MLVSSTQPPVLAPQTVVTQKPHLCVHTRFTDEVESWKTHHSLELVREMGASTLVEFFPWAYIEGTKGRYDWTRTDAVMANATQQGIGIIARLGFVPEWARPKNTANSTLNTLDLLAYPDFARFVGAFIKRYPNLEGVIIWNEPNLAFEWGYQEVSPEDYAHLLEVVYPVAKEANSNTLILGGALAPTREPEGSPHGLNDLLYLERFLRAGGAQHMDAFAVHTYGFTYSAIEAPHPDVLNFRRVELLHNLLTRYAPQMSVYVTEFGWNDHPRWTNGVRPSQRIQYTLEALQWAEKNWVWAEKLCVWAFRYPAPTLSYPDNFTLATTDFQLKPLYYALQAYAMGQESTYQWLPAPQPPPLLP